MDAMENIMTRRSIRRYEAKPVSEAVVTQLLKAAMAAPSAGNQQPWHFVVIDDHAVMDAIPEIHPYSRMLKEAAVAIMVCADVENERFKGYWVQDCSAATQNLLLAAHALGLGAVWLGCYPNKDRVAGLQRLLKLPDHIVPLSVVSIGYPAEEKAPSGRYDEARVHRNSW